MRSNSASLPAKCFTVVADALRLHAAHERGRQLAGEQRIFRVALEVAAGERRAVDVDRRREQDPARLGARLSPSTAPTRSTRSTFQVAPSAEPHGTQSANASPHAGTRRAPGAVRPVGDGDGGIAEPLDRDGRPCRRPR